MAATAEDDDYLERLLARLERLEVNHEEMRPIVEQVIGVLRGYADTLRDWPREELVEFLRCYIHGGEAIVGDRRRYIRDWGFVSPPRSTLVAELHDRIGRIGLRLLVAALTRSQEPSDDG